MARVEMAVASAIHTQSLARKYVRGTRAWAKRVAIRIFLELYRSMSRPKAVSYTHLTLPTSDLV